MTRDGRDRDTGFIATKCSFICHEASEMCCNHSECVCFSGCRLECTPPRQEWFIAADGCYEISLCLSFVWACAPLGCLESRQTAHLSPAAEKHGQAVTNVHFWVREHRFILAESLCWGFKLVSDQICIIVEIGCWCTCQRMKCIGCDIILLLSDRCHQNG